MVIEFFKIIFQDFNFILIIDSNSGPAFPSFFDNKSSFQNAEKPLLMNNQATNSFNSFLGANQVAPNDFLLKKLNNNLFESGSAHLSASSDIPNYSNLKNIWSNGSLNANNSNKSNDELEMNL